MPPSGRRDTGDWFPSDEIDRLPRQHLAREEFDSFLEVMFRNVAVRPKPVTLREGASVVRYLRATAWSSPGGLPREAVERLADAVTKMVLKAAPIRMAAKEQAIRFLTRHAETLLFHPQLRATLKFLRESPELDKDVDFFPKLKLASRERAVFGPGTLRLDDDLSERIYAAYHALRREKFHGASGLVAQALNRRGILAAKHSSKTIREWGAAEVSARTKHYEKLLKRDHHVTGKALASLRDALVDQWINFVKSQDVVVNTEVLGIRAPQ